MFAGSGPASVSRSATTPCAGTLVAYVRVVVPLAVCAQRSRTAYTRPARSHGLCTRLNESVAAAVSGFRSMITVPFCEGPDQYCAGCAASLVQSGCARESAPAVRRGGEGTDVVAPVKRRDALAVHRVLVDRDELLVLQDRQRLRRDGRQLPAASTPVSRRSLDSTNARPDEERCLHERPGRKVRLLLVVGHPAVPTMRDLASALGSRDHRVRYAHLEHVQIVPAVEVCRLRNERVAVSTRLKSAGAAAREAEAHKLMMDAIEA
jgi:hypothetical protein